MYWIQIQPRPRLYQCTGEAFFTVAVPRLAVVLVPHRSGAESPASDSLFELAPTSMAVVSKDGLVVNMNASMRALFGARPLAAVVGKPAYDTVAAMDRQRVDEAHEKAFNANASFSSVEYRLPSMSGDFLTLMSSWTPLPVPDNGLATALVVTHDVTAHRQTEAALVQATTMLRSFVQLNRANFWVVAPDGTVTFVTGIDSGNDDGQAAISFDEERAARPVHPEDVQRVTDLQARCFRTGTIFDCEYRRMIDGRFRWAHARAFPRHDQDGQIVCWYGSTEDIDDRKTAELRLIDSEAFSRRMIEASADIIQLIDLEGRLQSTNARGLEALGFGSQDAVVGKQWAALWPEASQPLAARAIEEAKTAGLGEFTAVGAKDVGGERWWSVVVTPMPDAKGVVTALMATARDFTQHKLAERHIHWLATHDPLTELANRRLFRTTVEEAMRVALDRGESLAVMLLDIDWFKEINDELGHDAGDAVLLAVAARLRELQQPVAMVARLGGDEFALLLTTLTSEAEAVQVVDALHERLHDPVDWNGRRLVTRCSVGIANFPDHSKFYGDLLRHADTALYVAKALGRSGHAFYVPAMQRVIERRAAVAIRVRASLASNIVPYYQPKVRLASGKLDGFEALLRISSPGRRIQTPSSISTAFDDGELAHLMSERMLDQVMADMRLWLDSGIDFGRIAVNAGAHELRRGAFADRVLERLLKADIPPALFEIEVTESVLLGRDTDLINTALRGLSAAGISIALDDFGTGYASLAHIKRYPVNTIKIDQSFIAGIGTDPADEAIVRALMALGQSLGITLVGEGVETAEQAAYLAHGGCNIGQGYLFSAAVPAAKLPALISRLGAGHPYWLASEKMRDAIRAKAGK